MLVEYLISGLVLILGYAWIGYSVLLAIASKTRGQGTGIRDRKSEVASGLRFHPSSFSSVSVIIAAHNEEAVIGQRIKNLLSERASLPRTEIFIGSDGSTDTTAAVAREYAGKHENVHVFDYKERRGKVAVLKNIIKESISHRGTEGTGHLLVFTDANTEFRPGAFEKMLRHFDDPDVGGVCGKLVFKEKAEGGDLSTTGRSASGGKPEGGDGGNVQFSTDKCPISKGVKSEESVHQSLRHGAGWIRRADCIENQTTPTTNNEEPTTKSPSEGFYWRWENWLKERESDLDSCLGANGAIYAVREECFWKDVPDSTIVDDFVIGMKVREQGKKMIYEPEAIAEEEYPETKGEWKRRVRIGAGDYQALALCRKCLGREYGVFAWIFWSHKVLRWFTPHILILLFALSFFSTGRQGGYYVINYELWLLLMAVFGRAMRDSDVVVAPFFRLFDHFVTMQAALFMGFIRYCKGGLQGSWDRTER